MPGIAAPAGPSRPRYLLFSVDAEPDDPDWKGLGTGPWTHENLRGLAGLRARLKAFGVKATWFVSHSTAAAGVLERELGPDLADGSCEIGSHFHPGDTPPFAAVPAAVRGGGDNAAALPDGALEGKFASLHAALSARFGPPRSHRAGAWTLDARLAGLLRRYGYAADSSVTPGVSWKANGRPSYLGAPMRAYRLGTGDPAVPGAEGPWEIPVSIRSPRRLPDPLARTLFGSFLTMPLASRGRAAALARLLRPPAPRWLRPAFADAEAMRETAENLESEGAEYLHAMCHSNELWPGASPYCRTGADAARFFSRLEGFFAWALGRGYMPVTVAGYAAALGEGRPNPGRS
jgi:hypothetical protein